MKLLRLSITINFTKMTEDNISQSGDYDVPFCEQQYTHGTCYISSFKFNSFDQFNTPQTASNFRHLLSCGTKGVLCFKLGLDIVVTVAEHACDDASKRILKLSYASKTIINLSIYPLQIFLVKHQYL